MLVERTRSHFLHRFDSFGGINAQLASVIGKKKTRKHPSGALIAVRKAVIPRKSKGVACRKCGRIRVAIKMKPADAPTVVTLKASMKTPRLYNRHHIMNTA